MNNFSDPVLYMSFTGDLFIFTVYVKRRWVNSKQTVSSLTSSTLSINESFRRLYNSSNHHKSIFPPAQIVEEEVEVTFFVIKSIGGKIP